jgi:hypothetical protein
VAGDTSHKDFSEKINRDQQRSRVFLGLDGHPYISDRYGTRRAPASAIAIMAIQTIRLDGFREEVANG